MLSLAFAAFTNFFKGIGLRWTLTVILLACFGLTLAAASYTLKAEREKVIALNVALESERNTVRQLRQAVDDQNKAVDEMKRASDEMKARAEKAVAEAKKEAARQYDLATRVLQRKPVGNNDYDATQDLIAEAIHNVEGDKK